VDDDDEHTQEDKTLFIVVVICVWTPPALSMMILGVPSKSARVFVTFWNE
jgi:hypothetical protein